MTEEDSYARLTQNWLYWSTLGQLAHPSVSTSCDDCAVVFSSDESSVHLRHHDGWWVIDTVNDRRQRQNDTARFSSYELAEKYLVWMWASTARSAVRAPVLGPTFYAMGFAPGVQAIPVSEGVYELRSPRGRAVTTEPYATIFSHLMDKPEHDIQRIVRAGING
ncbi:hypothetical protein ACQ856_02065 [Mycolicibacterium psychrotolerans]|uniref:hypothetical protein n=1 Tax=Mycolicibacterium psychrotolerans TaxID=216929 RepID=UPI003D66C07E